MLVVIVPLVAADLEDAEWLVVASPDDDIDDRDDAVRGIKRRWIEARVRLQIADDGWVPGDEGASLRRRHIGARDHVADHTVLPAMDGDDEQVVLLGAVAPHFAERDIEAFGAGPGRFGEDLRRIPLAQREVAEAGDGGLLA